MKTTLRTLCSAFFTAIAVTGALADNPVSVTWMDNGSTETSGTTSVENVFSLTSFSLGSNIGLLNTTGFRDPYTFIQFRPVESIAQSRSVENEFTFKVTPKKGVTFTPQRVTFAGTKYGTSGGDIEVFGKSDSGTETTLLTKMNLQRDNSNGLYYSELDININDVSVSGESYNIIIALTNLAYNKSMGLSSITLEGIYSGSAVEVPAYTLSALPADKDAGTVIINPVAEKYDEGSLITLTATENFGYHFRGWADTDNEIVSTENPYKMIIEKDTDLKATYHRNNVYTFDINYSEGVNPNLVSVSPIGTTVNGKIYYEEGTEVSLTAINNPIFTFNSWDDNSTTMTRLITMDQDMNVSANFSNRDYIVGWDLYLDNPASSRPADYKSNSENAGLLVLKNSVKEEGWLSKGCNNGPYNDKYCAVNWKPFRANSDTNGEVLPDSDRFHYEISFSSSDYTNIEILATMGLNYNAFQTQLVEYSLDGTQYTKVSEIVIPGAKQWASCKVALPQTCDNQPKVYVRFRADEKSPVIGTSTGVDGTCITDIFVLAEEALTDDSEAPVLVASNPQQNETGASASGSILLTFNERVVEGNGDCVLNGEILAPTFSGKTIVLPYKGLAYNTSYTFTLPAGKVLDRSGNSFEGLSLTFTTMERTQPAAKIYDMVIAADGSGNYTSVQAAIDAAPAGQVRPYLIFVKNGTYKEHINIPSSKPYLHFIGQNPDKVKFTDDRLCGSTGDSSIPTYHVSEGATVVCDAENIMFENIIFENSWGVDKNNGPQALALYTRRDRVVFNNCKMLSYQDTWLTSKRNYAKECFIEGAVDFIYGAGDVYFDRCTINIVRQSGGYIVAPNHSGDKWGYVFMNNKITTDRVTDPSTYSVWLGRPWNNNPKTVWINTIAEVTIPAGGWYQTMGGLPELWAEYNTMDKNGQPVDLSNRNTYYYKMVDGVKVEHDTKKAVLTDEEAAAYTVKNVLSGDDAWDPSIMTESCQKPNARISGTNITWEAVPYAICYVISSGDDILGFTVDTEFTVKAEGNYSIQSVNEFGGLSEASSVLITSVDKNDATTSVISTEYYSVEGIRYSSPRKGTNIIKYKMSDGQIKTEKLYIR